MIRDHVTEVHCAQKVALLALKLQAARRAALVHAREDTKNRCAKNSPRPTARAKVVQDSHPCRNVHPGIV